MSQFDSMLRMMDPSPFIEKDLDDDAEEFIVSWAQGISPNAPLKLRIYLDQWPAEDPTELIRTAVRNHFAHRAEITYLGFKRLLRQGRTSLFIGLLFLAACLLLSKMLLVMRRALGLPSCGRALRSPDGSPCGDPRRFTFTIGGLCCDEAESMPS